MTGVPITIFSNTDENSVDEDSSEESDGAVQKVEKPQNQDYNYTEFMGRDAFENTLPSTKQHIKSVPEIKRSRVLKGKASEQPSEDDILENLIETKKVLDADTQRVTGGKFDEDIDNFEEERRKTKQSQVSHGEAYYNADFKMRDKIDNLLGGKLVSGAATQRALNSMSLAHTEPKAMTSTIKRKKKQKGFNMK